MCVARARVCGGLTYFFRFPLHFFVFFSVFDKSRQRAKEAQEPPSGGQRRGNCGFPPREGPEVQRERANKRRKRKEKGHTRAGPSPPGGRASHVPPPLYASSSRAGVYTFLRSLAALEFGGAHAPSRERRESAAGTGLYSRAQTDGGESRGEESDVKRDVLSAARVPRVPRSRGVRPARVTLAGEEPRGGSASRCRTADDDEDDRRAPTQAPRSFVTFFLTRRPDAWRRVRSFNLSRELSE